MSDTLEILNSFRRVVRALRVNSQDIRVECGLSGAQLFVLQKIALEARLSVNEIAARTNTDQSSVSVVLTKLLAKGMLKRETDANDGRRFLHSVTSAGKKIAERSDVLVQDHLLRAIEALSIEDRLHLAELLRRVVQGAELSSQPPSLFFEETATKSSNGKSKRPPESH